jgi:hypothetical protein
MQCILSHIRRYSRHESSQATQLVEEIFGVLGLDPPIVSRDLGDKPFDPLARPVNRHLPDGMLQGPETRLLLQEAGTPWCFPMSILESVADLWLTMPYPD